MTTIDTTETGEVHVGADDWMSQGACKGSHPSVLPPLPPSAPRRSERRESAAEAVCASCQVRSDCMVFAREHHEYGFWGGESEDERHAAGYRLIAPIGVRAPRELTSAPNRRPVQAQPLRRNGPGQTAQAKRFSRSGVVRAGTGRRAGRIPRCPSRCLRASPGSP